MGRSAAGESIKDRFAGIIKRGDDSSRFIFTGGMGVEHRFEDIFGARLAVSPEHGFGEDALQLALFAAPRPTDTALDLCTGCGIIPAFWLSAGLPKSVAALDIAPRAVELCRLTAAENGWAGRFSPVCADLREHGFEREGFTLVTANPPYFEQGAGGVSAKGPSALARSETACTLLDVAQAAAWALRCGGRFCLCHRPQRLADVIMTLRAAGLEPKRLALVSHSPGAKPWLLLAEGRKGGGRGLETELLTDSVLTQYREERETR